MLNNYVIVWAVIALLLFVAEAVTEQLVSIWFAIAALIVSILAAFTQLLPLQIIVFVLIAALLLIFTRPFVKSKISRDKIPMNLETIIGKKGLVTEGINNLHGQGRVLVEGVLWTARSGGGEEIEKDETIEVLFIDGVKLIVK